MRITEEKFKDFRRQVWPYVRGYIEERIEMHRELLEVGPIARTQHTKDTDDMLRGRNQELRTLIDAIENDEMLLAEIEQIKQGQAKEKEDVD